MTKNMKTNIAYLKGLLCLLLALSFHNVAYSWGRQATSLEDLTAGSVIEIYPCGYYNVTSFALSCAGDGQELTSYSGCGEEWTLIDAGDGYFYLKNELGCYWAYQDNDASHSLTCTTDISSAVAVSMTWDDKHNGVCFWNKTDGTGLYSANDNTYNWYSPSYYDGDFATAFEVYVDHPMMESENVVVIDGLRLLLDQTKKTARVVSNSYKGDIVVPQSVDYNGITYAITDLYIGDFERCTSIDARYCNVGNIGEWAFISNHKLTSLSIGHAGFIGERAFENCSNLKSVSIGNVDSIGWSAFCKCNKLTSVSIGHVGFIGEVAFGWGDNLVSASIDSVDSLKSLAFGSSGAPLISIKQIRYIENIDYRTYHNIKLKCYVENPDDIDATEDACYSLKRLFVPKSSVEDYKNTKPWNKMADRIYPIADIPVTQIVLPETAHIKEKGEEGKIQLVPTFYPANVDIKTVEWKSSDENIVKVDENGYVTGVNMGEANIIVTSLDGSEKTDTCKVTVGAIDPETISFVGMPTEVYVGSYIENVTKKVKVTPEDADYAALTITTSDKDVLRYYNTDKILAKSIGTAQVIATLTLSDGSELSTSCDVNVVEDPTGVNSVTANDVKAMVSGNLLTVEGVAADDIITVANVSGQTIYRGTHHEIVLPSNGVYIIKVKGQAMKVSVK